MKKVLFLLLLLIPAVLPLLRTDFFHFSDEPNISLIYEMSRALTSGQVPPRWIPDVSYTFGHPLFNFYYPLPYFLGSLIYFVSSSLITSIKLYFLLTVVVSFAGMLLFLRKHTTLFFSTIGALVYVYTPYRAVDLYVRGAIGELTAFAVAPFVCLFIYKVFEKQNLRNVAFLAIATAIFILSHNLAIMLFFPWFLVYALWLYFTKSKNRRFLVTFGLALTLGIGVSFFWLLPAVIERNLLFGETPFYYKDHFPFIKQLIYSPFRYGSSLPGAYDDVTFQIGFANQLLVLLTFLVFLKTKNKNLKVLAFLVLGAFAACIFLMNIRSSFLWEAFSLAGYFQFPWRILMLTTFLTAFSIIFVKNKIVGTVVLVVALANTITYFQPSEYYSPTDDYFFKRFFSNRNADGESQIKSPEYKNYSEDYLLLPIWVDVRPNDLPKSKFTTPLTSLVTIEETREITAVHYVAEVDNIADRVEVPTLPADYNLVNINTYYFPGWQVRLDGQDVATQIAKPHGSMVVEVPTGKHTLELKWTETPLRKLADYISLVSSVFIVVFLFGNRLGFSKHGD